MFSSSTSVPDCLTGGLEPQGSRASRAGMALTAKVDGRRLDGRYEIRGKTSGTRGSAQECMSSQPAAMHFPTEGDEGMRAIKLITVSTAAVLMGGTSLAIGQESAGSLQGGRSMLEDTALSQDSARGSEIEGANPRAAENPMRRSATSGERGSKAQHSRVLQRSQAMQRGQAMTAGRGRTLTANRGQAATADHRRATAAEL